MVNAKSIFWCATGRSCRSKWPRVLRRRSTVARPLRLWVGIPPWAWLFICCVLSGRGLCDGLITRPEEAYRMWRVVVCDQETSNEEAKARYGTVENTTERVLTPRKQTNKPVEAGKCQEYTRILVHYR